MCKNTECKIPLIDWGVKGRDIESYVSIAIQPNLQLSTKHPFREAIAWKNIDKDLSCECYCGDISNQKSWDAIRRNLNKLDKGYDDVGGIVSMGVVDKSKVIGLKYKREHEGDTGPHAYVSIPCDSVIDIMHACTSKIDFIVYLIILRKYLVDNQLKNIADTAFKTKYVMCLPKYIATQVSYNTRMISDAVTRLKNAGLIRIEDEYVYNYNKDCTYHLRNLKIRNLEEWHLLKSSGYDFKSEINKSYAKQVEGLTDNMMVDGVPLLPKNKKSHQYSRTDIDHLFDTLDKLKNVSKDTSHEK